MTLADSEIQTVFDADNHYWEVSDSFTRHRDPEFADRGVVLKEMGGKPYYFFGERAHPIIPGPGDAHPRPRPGALYDYDRLDSCPQERLWDYPADEMRLVQKAVGYERILVNGDTTFIDGECTDATPGRLLRHGRD